jgi:hypothetical protein
MRRPTRRILTPGERQTLRAQERELTAQMETPTIMMGPNGPIRVPDRSNLEYPYRVQAERQKIKKVLDEGTPNDLNKREIVERDRRIRELEERVGKRLVPHEQFHMADDGGSTYRKVVSEIVSQESDPVFKQAVAELKNLRRERDSDNPNAGGIEDLRGEKKIVV